MQFDSRYQRLSETRGRWPGRETNGQALDGTKRQREHRLELLLFLLVLLFLRDLVQLEAELAFAHALALPAPGAAVAWVKAVFIDDADDDDDNDDNDDDDDDDEDDEEIYFNQERVVKESRRLHSHGSRRRRLKSAASASEAGQCVQTFLEAAAAG